MPHVVIEDAIDLAVACQSISSRQSETEARC